MSSTVPAAVILCLAAVPAVAEWMHAQIVVSADYVHVGQPFVVKIRVLGSVLPERPDTSVVKDFTVEFEGKEWNPSRGDTIYTYLFRAKRAGTLHIPPIPVSGAGASTKTARVTVRAREPADSDAELRLVLEETECYIGQRVSAELVFRARGDVRSFQFDAPFLHDERLTAVLPHRGFVVHPPDGYTRVNVNRMATLARADQSGKGEERRNSIRVSMVLIPKRPGAIRLEGANVQARLHHVKRREPQVLFVPAAGASLNVEELPVEDRPESFSGLVGRYRLEAVANRREVRVGDPIVFALRLGGQPYLADLRLPSPAEDQELSRNFQISPAAPEHELRDDIAEFRYILRARRQTVREIPGLAYNYFDPEAREYVIAKTEPIPLRVAAGRVVTAADAEGATVAQREVTEPRDSAPGIAHNFEDAGALAGRATGVGALIQSPALTGAIALPPLVFLALLLALRWKRR